MRFKLGGTLLEARVVVVRKGSIPGDIVVDRLFAGLQRSADLSALMCQGCDPRGVITDGVMDL